MIQGRIHSIETFGSVDGPGTRFIIFLQGCAMRCLYCHNVDTWNGQQGGELRTADELLDQAERYRPYWGDEGGITVSGGEPLLQMKEMAKAYGYDISNPAKNAKEAVQWLYFGYLAAIKTQNGAAMSVGRISTFLDIYISRDLAEGTLTETQAQELIDHLTLKFRMVKFARIQSYNQLFSGDPVWATLEMAGVGMDGRHMVTRTDYRFLHTLENMGPSPEPNLTVLYSPALPAAFKKYAARISIETSSIQYENDDVMKPVWATTTASAAAFRPRRRARRCSSSERAPTLPNACSTPSTAARTKNS